LTHTSPLQDKITSHSTVQYVNLILDTYMTTVSKLVKDTMFQDIHMYASFVKNQCNLMPYLDLSVSKAFKWIKTIYVLK
jgi:hypothetical protein